MKNMTRQQKELLLRDTLLSLVVGMVLGRYMKFHKTSKATLLMKSDLNITCEITMQRIIRT